MHQVHGRAVAVVDGPQDPAAPLPEADALVTTSRGLGLVVLVADCVPVLLAARRSDAVAVAHAGRRGVEAGVVPATVAAMQELGARPSRIVAVVGPAVCGALLRGAPRARRPGDRGRPGGRAPPARAGTPALDLRAGVVAQLLAAGVETIEADPWCTAESPDLFSHRRDGVTGRFAGVVVT